MLLNKTITELLEGIKNKHFSTKEVVSEALAHIEQYEPQLNSFITIRDKDEIVKEAEAKDKDNSNSRLPLNGIPYVLKDAYVTKGIRTTAASKILENYIPQYSATVYQKLKDSGAILLGKMNMDAWGHGGSNENTDFRPVKNPYDKSRVAGGSSGGPAAAVASRMCSFAIGEDTGGSIRNPSAWCNITGLKVTYGRVSRYGTIAYASSFDTVGPMAKTAEDCAKILRVIAGKDKYDATSASQEPEDYSRLLENSLESVRIGLPQELFGDGLDPEIRSAILAAIKKLEDSGCKIVKLSLPLLEFGLAVYYLIAPSETSSNLARYDSIRYGNERSYFTEETMRRIMIGTYALSAGYYDAYYRKALRVRTLLIQEYEKAFNQCDVLVMPVTPTPPPKIGELISNPLTNILADIYTTTQNPAGVPSLAIPCGFTSNNLPIGLQIVGPMFSEDRLLQIGYQYQQLTNWHTKRPK